MRKRKTLRDGGAVTQKKDPIHEREINFCFVESLIIIVSYNQ